jgi:hypothetical protein
MPPIVAGQCPVQTSKNPQYARRQHTIPNHHRTRRQQHNIIHPSRCPQIDPVLAPSALINALGPDPQCPQLMQKPSMTPDNDFWPPNLVKLVKSSLRTDSPPLCTHLFVFELSQEAAQRNYCMLKRFNMSIKRRIRSPCNIFTRPLTQKAVQKGRKMVDRLA